MGCVQNSAEVTPISYPLSFFLIFSFPVLLPLRRFCAHAENWGTNQLRFILDAYQFQCDILQFNTCWSTNPKVKFFQQQVTYQTSRNGYVSLVHGTDTLLELLCALGYRSVQKLITSFMIQTDSFHQQQPVITDDLDKMIESIRFQTGIFSKSYPIP